MTILRKLFGRAPEIVKTTNRSPVEEPVFAASAQIGLPNKEYRFIAIDVETANSDAKSICQIGLAGIDATGTLETTSIFVNPNDHFEEFNIDLHGIDEDAVADAPYFADVIELIRPLLETYPLVQHSTFDQKAINLACTENGVPNLRAEWHDSLKIARRAWPELKGNGGHGLANLKQHLGLVFNHHDAGEDARAAADIVLLAEHLTKKTFDVLSRSNAKKVYPTSISIDGSENGPLYGQVACFTGALTISRTDAATLAAAAGISVKTTISKKINLLVVGDQDLQLLAGHDKSSKHRRAEALVAEGHQIQIIGETEFLKLIDQ